MAQLKLVDPLSDIVKSETKKVKPYPDMRYADRIHEFYDTIKKNCGKKNFDLGMLLGDMYQMALPVEKAALELNIEHIRVQLIRSQYPQFKSLDFLTQAITKTDTISHDNGRDVFDVSLKLPKWGVFPYQYDNNNTVYFWVSCERYFNSKEHSPVHVETGISLVSTEEIRGKLLEAIKKNFPDPDVLRRSSQDLQGGTIYVRTVKSGYLPEDIAPNFGDPLHETYTRREYTYKTELKVEIPDSLRTDLRIAEKIFGRDNLFFIAERKPEDWVYRAMPSFTNDPMVVGYHEKEGFFHIVNFKSTFEEAKVKRDYVKKKK